MQNAKETPKITTENKFKENPRKISPDQFRLLKEHLEELGDLSGVIFCVNNQAYVGGNQRSEVFNGAEIEIIERFDTPTKNKTIAHGFINYNNEKYSYREVAFSESEFKKACIVANNDGGTWDYELLKVEFDENELIEWGMDLPEISEPVTGKKEKYTGIFPLSIILTKTDYEKWQAFKKTYKLRSDTEGFMKLMEENLAQAK